MNGLRIVALEEHVQFSRFAGEIDRAAVAERGYRTGAGADARATQLDDILGARLQSMDRAGIDVEVLSVVGPGADILAPDAGPPFARKYNDEVNRHVKQAPKRFAGFAHLPLSNPDAAADELERCVRELGFCGALVNGATGGKFLDDKMFEPVLARAAALDAPIYIHPGIPAKAVREAYYDGFDPMVSFSFANAGFGWHIETAIHVVRLVLSGAFDRHPNLKVIIGHMGEGLPMFFWRLDHAVGKAAAKTLKRTISETILDQVWITIAGFFTVPPFMAALLTFGADRILFSVDYPFADNMEARAFLDALPVTESDRKKIAHENADRLLKLG